MSISKRALQKYFRQVKGELLCPRKTRKQIMEDLKKNVSLYLEEHPEATIENILHTFGSPRQIAASYVEELPTPELIKKLKLRKRILHSAIAFVTAVALLCTLMWGTAILIALHEVQDRSDPYYQIITEVRP